jgi:hypothetical protein
MGPAIAVCESHTDQLSDALERTGNGSPGVVNHQAVAGALALRVSEPHTFDTDRGGSGAVRDERPAGIGADGDLRALSSRARRIAPDRLRFIQPTQNLK